MQDLDNRLVLSWPLVVKHEIAATAHRTLRTHGAAEAIAHRALIEAMDSKFGLTAVSGNLKPGSGERAAWVVRFVGLIVGLT